MPFALSFFRPFNQRFNFAFVTKIFNAIVLLLLYPFEHHLSIIGWLDILEVELAGHFESIAHPTHINVLKQGEIVKNFCRRRGTVSHCMQNFFELFLFNSFLCLAFFGPLGTMEICREHVLLAFAEDSVYCALYLGNSRLTNRSLVNPSVQFFNNRIVFASLAQR